MAGFFKTYREIFKHEIFKDELGFRLFMLIVGNAVYTVEGLDHKGIHLKRGQWLRSYRKLAEDLKYKEGRGYKNPSLSTIKRAVDRLVKLELVSISGTDSGTLNGTDSGTLFTVLNYEEYQGFHHDDKTDSGTLNGTDSDQLVINKRNKTKKDKEEGNKKKKEYSRKPNVYDDESLYMKMAQYLKKKILAWKDNAKIPDDLNKWADDFRKLVEIDKRTKEEIRDVIDFATEDSFWQANIMSASKLRNKFDQLQAQRMRKNNNQNQGQVINFEAKREQQRIKNFDLQKAVGQFVAAGFNPDDDRDLLEKWLNEGANINELNNLRSSAG